MQTKGKERPAGTDKRVFFSSVNKSTFSLGNLIGRFNLRIKHIKGNKYLVADLFLPDVFVANTAFSCCKIPLLFFPAAVKQISDIRYPSIEDGLKKAVRKRGKWFRLGIKLFWPLFVTLIAGAEVIFKKKLRESLNRNVYLINEC